VTREGFRGVSRVRIPPFPLYPRFAGIAPAFESKNPGRSK
jgi:hypothetical protein